MYPVPSSTTILSRANAWNYHYLYRNMATIALILWVVLTGAMIAGNETVLYKPYRGANGKYGIASAGRIVLPALYDSVGEYAHGRALIRYNGLYGFVNEQALMVIPCVYVYARSFENGRALVATPRGYTFIDVQGIHLTKRLLSAVGQNIPYLGYIAKIGDRFTIVDETGAPTIKESYDTLWAEHTGKRLILKTWHSGEATPRTLEKLLTLADMKRTENEGRMQADMRWMRSVQDSRYRSLMQGKLPLPKDSVMARIRVQFIDEYAMNTPESYTTDIKRLAEYLCKPARNDFEKVRAIFRWITHNVSYDYKGYASGDWKQYQPCDAKSVLQNRVCVCAGYAYLFEAMLDSVGIEAHWVGGFAGGQNLTTKNKDEFGHAWNIAKMEGRWYAFDVTWAAGYLTQANDAFIRHFKEEYFCSEPVFFLQKHFPETPVGAFAQLIEQPITWSKFLALQKAE